MTSPPMTPPQQIRRGPPREPPPLLPANAPVNPLVPIAHALTPEHLLMPAPPPYPPPSPDYVIFPNDGQGNPPPPNTLLAHPIPLDDVPPGPSFADANQELMDTIHDWIAASEDLENLVPDWHLQVSWQYGPRQNNLAEQVFRDGTFDNPIEVEDDPATDANVIDLTDSQ